MQKKILIATSVLAITAGSIFAYSNTRGTAAAKASTEQCPSECCNGNGGNCGRDQCEKNNEECCGQ